MREQLLYKMGYVRRDRYEQVCKQFAKANVKYMKLYCVLEQLAKDTPHKAIEEEITNVLRETDSQ